MPGMPALPGTPTSPGVPATPGTGAPGVTPPYAIGFVGIAHQRPPKKPLAQGRAALPLLLTVLFELP